MDDPPPTVYLSSIMPAPQIYSLHGRDILLPADSMLPSLQHLYPAYDAFFPALARRLPPGWIIDVGANVGDTLYALLEAKDAHFLCVEPQQNFYALLQKNIASLSAALAARVHAEQCLITDSPHPVTLQRARGTAHARPSDQDSGLPQCSLTELASRHGIAPDGLAFVKIDTDGSDDRCLCSGMDLFAKGSPIIMWENQIDHKDHFARFARCCSMLEKLGYADFYLLDNTGNYLCKSTRVGLLEVSRYIGQCLTQQGKTSLPLASKVAPNGYYLDVVACKKPQQPLLEKTLAEHRAKFG